MTPDSVLVDSRQVRLDPSPMFTPWAALRLHFVSLVVAATIAVAVSLSRGNAESESVAALDPVRLGAMDAAIEQAIREERCPGGVLWIEHGPVSYHKAYGNRAVVPASEAMTDETIFDAASLTKVMATAPAIMQLVEKGKIKLDVPAMTYLPEFRGGGREGITIRQLLTHTSGLRSGLPRITPWKGTAAAIKLASNENLQDAPGSKFTYSDINFILLGEIVARVDGRRLDDYCALEIFGPLGMRDTGFRPLNSALERPASSEGLERIAPTERAGDGSVIRGVVHDPTARRMGGVAGHAGVFTTASDLARFARMMLGAGELDGKRILSKESVELMTQVQSPPTVTVRRGLGWDIDSAYAGPRGYLFPIGSYGHTGWTGTSLWIDPFSKSFVIFLSNRNHPTEQGNILALRRRLGTLAAEAVGATDWCHVLGALSVGPDTVQAPTNSLAVQTSIVLDGVDVLESHEFKPLKGLRVGLITNQTGRDRSGRSTVDLLARAPQVELKALFSPEHGLRGTADEKVKNSVDEATGLPVYSLYGETMLPIPAQLEGLDALVFDIQDIGCRFYTYLSTLGNCLEAAAHAHLKFFVLDRVNPIGGINVDGPVLTAPRSFVGWHEIPIQHGMTIGELARMFVAERKLEVALTVVPCAGWRRCEWFDNTGLPWVNPSPNIRNLTAATLYPGLGVIEFCGISVGRGTGTPFELVGAPYVNAGALLDLVNAANLPGVRFEKVEFVPDSSKFAGQTCRGLHITLTDRRLFRPLDLGLVLAEALNRLHPVEFELSHSGRLWGNESTVDALVRGVSRADIRRGWERGLIEFVQRREPFLLYR